MKNPAGPDASRSFTPAAGGGALWLRWLVALLAGLATGALLTGFVLFVDTVEEMSPPDAPRADAIAVLTGDFDRIGGALALLAAGRADRLLISGVNPANSLSAISKKYPEFAELFTRRVDLDRSSSNTRQNAVQTARWVRVHGIERLILVTSDYHMPRAHSLLRGALPEIEIVPYPISTGGRERAGAGGSGRPALPAQARRFMLLFEEYLKYGFERIRHLPMLWQNSPQY